MEGDTATAIVEAPAKGILKYRKGPLGRYPSVDCGDTGGGLLGRVPSVDCGESCFEEVMEALISTPEVNGNAKPSPSSLSKVSLF